MWGCTSKHKKDPYIYNASNPAEQDTINRIKSKYTACEKMIKKLLKKKKREQDKGLGAWGMG